MSKFLLFLQMLPEIIKFINYVSGLLKEGYTLIQVKSKISKITKAFDEKNPSRRSAMLNSAFKKL